MAPVLQCPDCGTKHPLSAVPADTSTFPCRGCGRTLKVPEFVPRTARSSAPAAAPAARSRLPRAGRAVRVEAGLQLVDEPERADLGFDRALTNAMVDRRQLAHELRQSAAPVRGEVRPHSCPQVRCIADVEQAATAI